MIFHTDDSIVAIATPPGRGAISTIRLSGRKALETARKQIWIKEGITPAPRTVYLGHFLNLQGEFLDEVLFTFFAGPNSYTGEDLVEISCHGSPVIARNIVNTFLGLGVRLAEPGEFTLRAVLHGKLDLLQAEAIQDLVESQTGFQVQHAANQLRGQLSRALGSIRRILLEVVCQLESGIEFVEEGLSLASREELLERLEGVDRELGKLEESFEAGRIVRDGIQVVLTGKPNVGKSSIFNGLTGFDGAIVTDVPGTTRDALREVIAVDGIPITLVDTAGIRDEQEQSVEHLGVERSLRYLNESDLALFVVDRSAAYDEEDERIWNQIQKMPYLLLINKIDLSEEMKLPGKVAAGSIATVEVSALQNRNLDRLRLEIGNYAFPGSRTGEERPSMTRLRHKRCTEEARKQLRNGMSVYLAGQGEELALYNLRKSLEALGALTGEVTTDEILDEVFASFCIGK